MFKSKKIPFPEDYSHEKNRASLQTIFTFSDLKTYGGANLDAIHQKLIKAKEAFSIYKVEANRFYPEILSRRKFLQRLLASIPPNQQLEAQAKLIFEIKVPPRFMTYATMTCQANRLIKFSHKFY